eukprot:NODE_1685_length_787_cov_344.509485_g1409_i0.p2 GENE.NODE_1685_length_787_cov_344.509485_g1409_i0~~NODE_1685_length_787_cov_344.509485_g1409_i0.p2  ORF type:complete len:127 (+),score=25.25 NODE_1685_length_787_cov_344.509485_g1409_i0:82-462(+)
MAHPVYYFVIGPPGSGKGTNAQRAATQFGLTFMSAGDLLREVAQGETERGKMVKDLMLQGKIVPMEITIGLLHDKMKETNAKAYLIDGFPRNIPQGDLFEQTVGECKKALLFECPVRAAAPASGAG